MLPQTRKKLKGKFHVTRFHARTAALAAAAPLAGGCFDHAVPAGRDVVARTPAEAEALRDTVTFLDFHEANLSAFPEGLGAYPKLRRLSVQGQKGAAAVPASVAEAKGLVELDLIATGVKDLPPDAEDKPMIIAAVQDNSDKFLPRITQHDGEIRIACSPTSSFITPCRRVLDTINTGYEILANEYPDYVRAKRED